MSTRKPIRKRTRRPKKSLIGLDITSLLDVLVILLAFLLKNFNSSGIVVDVPKEITLPKSKTSSPNTAGVIVQVSPNKIWVDNNLILDENEKPARLYDHGGRRIIPLFEELLKKKKANELLRKTTKEAKPFSGVINLVVDKSIKYSFVKKILYTSAEAGYRKYKFVVMGQSNL